MKLKYHIQNAHKGNISEFARSQGVLPSQAQRWLKRDCEWHQDGVWCRITKQVKANETNVRTIKG